MVVAGGGSSKAGHIKTAFPVHDRAELVPLRQWGSWSQLNCARGAGASATIAGLFGVPTPRVRDYFGEPLALYFAWVQCELETHITAHTHGSTQHTHTARHTHTRTHTRHRQTDRHTHSSTTHTSHTQHTAHSTHTCGNRRSCLPLRDRGMYCRLSLNAVL